MSRNSSEKLTAQDRLTLARRVKELRFQAGYRQDELAELAGVSRQTLSDIENANTSAPQMKTLIRIYDALGVDIAPPEFEEQTQLWLAMLGSLIEAVPDDRRSSAVDKAVVAITSEIGRRSNVTPFPGRDVGTPAQDDLHLAARPADPEPTDEQPSYDDPS